MPTALRLLNAQVTLGWAGDGTIFVLSGSGQTGTIIGTYPSQFVINTWDSYQFKVVINNTNGYVEMRKNGSTNALFTPLSNVNTRAGSTNTSVNGIQIWNGAAGGNCYIDDLFLCSGLGAAPNTWFGDARGVTQYPANVIKAQFTGVPTTIASSGPPITSLSSNFPTGTLYISCAAIIVNDTGNVGSLSLNFQSGMTGHVIAAIYDTSGTGGSPGNLLGVSNVFVNPVGGANTFTFSTPIPVTKGLQYFPAFLADATLTLTGGAYGGANTSIWALTGNYSNGFPSSALGMSQTTGFYGALNVTFNITPSNADLVSTTVEDGVASYVYSSTVGAEDLYTITPLPVTPVAIIGCMPVVIWEKTDSGARVGGLQCIANGSADTTVASTIPSLSWTATQGFLPTDPTGAAWTVSTVNSMQIGMKIIS